MRIWWWLLITTHLVYSNPVNYENLYQSEVNKEDLQGLLEEADDDNNVDVTYSRRKRSLEEEEREKKQLKFHSWGGKRYENHEEEGEEDKETKINENIETSYNLLQDNLIPYPLEYSLPNGSNLETEIPTYKIRDTYEKRLKQSPAFTIWGGKRDPEVVNDIIKKSNIFESIFQGGSFRPRMSEQSSKRYPAFNSWAGKRAPAFNSWGGKRAPAFNSWGGKRAPAFNSWGGKRATAFNSWGGKRATAFNSWGGKRAPAFNSWGGKRATAPAFNSWGGKRAPAFNSWGGKRAPAFLSGEEKRTAGFNSWGGKRSDAENNLDATHEPKNSVSNQDNSEFISGFSADQFPEQRKIYDEEEDKPASVIRPTKTNHRNVGETSMTEALPFEQQAKTQSVANQVDNNISNDIDVQDSESSNEIKDRTDITWLNSIGKPSVIIIPNYTKGYLYNSKRGMDARQPSFSSWAGKRNLEIDQIDKRANPFSSWTGKRSPVISSWYGGNKIPTVQLSNGKRRPAFSSWGGKRSVNEEVLQTHLSLDSPQEDYNNLDPVNAEPDDLDPNTPEKHESRKKRSIDNKDNKYASHGYKIACRDKKLFSGVKKTPFMPRMLVQGGITWPMMVNTLPKGINFYAWGGKRSL